MIRGWNDALAREFRMLATLRSNDAEYSGDIRLQIPGFPGPALRVYRDMGGDLFVLATGVVVSLNTESGDFAVEEDPNWIRVATARLADKFPEMRVVAEMPIGGSVCDHCLGGGYSPRAPLAICGTCYGLGWLESGAREREDDPLRKSEG